jgi:hypothetical protein
MTKWYEVSTTNDGEVALFRADFENSAGAVEALTQAKTWWYGAYKPTPATDELTSMPVEVLRANNIWILDFNCHAPHATCDPYLTFDNAEDILDPDVMRHSPFQTYSVFVPQYDDSIAVLFKLKFA